MSPSADILAHLDSILQTIMEKMAEYFRPDTWSLLMVMKKKTSSISPSP